MPYIPRPLKKRKAAETWRSELRRKVYNSARWRRLRDVKLSMSPVCEICEEQGRYVPAVDVHHRRSFVEAATPEEAQAIAYDYGNLMSLCKECHGKIHARRDSCNINNEGK